MDMLIWMDNDFIFLKIKYFYSVFEYFNQKSTPYKVDIVEDSKLCIPVRKFSLPNQIYLHKILNPCCK